MALPTLTGVGRLVDDPELRFTSAGKAVAKVRIAFSDRRKNPQTNEWEDGDKCFLDAAVWEQEAENLAESLGRGCEVLVTGKLKQRSYETRDGERRTVYELAFASIAPTLRYATAKVQKMQRSGGQQSRPAQADDQWATTAPAGTGSGFDTEPPF